MLKCFNATPEVAHCHPHRHSGARHLARARNPYSVLVVMDSGLAAARRLGMTAEIGDVHPRSRDAFAPGVPLVAPPSEIEEGAGNAGCRCTRELACSKNAHKRTRAVHRYNRTHAGIPCAMVLRLIRALPGVPCSLASVACEFVTHRLDLSVGRSGPRDFAVRIRHVRPTWHPRPSHPRLTDRDDRPKRPSCQRRDGREGRSDLPDEASATACGRLARRAICAWRVCGNCPSGVRTDVPSKTNVTDNGNSVRGTVTVESEKEFYSSKKASSTRLVFLLLPTCVQPACP